ncbi:MAG: hypothetical protein PHE55_13360 [Methylococcaceae bacterium]|nr:hypothetical protein [Methylococcaceae bacterium]
MTTPLRLAVLGLDTRAQNLFRMFFRGPCLNQAVIVDHDNDAEAFLIDLDTQNGAKLFALQREKYPNRVIIVLSLKDQTPIGATVFVKKPAQAQSMLSAIEKTRALIKEMDTQQALQTRFKRAPEPPPPPPLETSRRRTDNKPAPAELPEPATQPADAPPAMKVVARADKEEMATHKVAMLLDEQSFKSYLGYREDIDPANPAQLASVYYDPKEFLQGHIQSACKIAFARNHPIRLETPWKSITILPEQGLVHIVADEAQIRAACGIPFRSIIGIDVDSPSQQQRVSIKPLTKSEFEEISDSPHLVRLDAFLWKIALLTSKGRIPQGLDLQQAFHLKNWPSMTRMLLPPQAMRIAGLLTQQPQTLFAAAAKLGIRQQYVFAFISAAHALGLTEQKPVVIEVEEKPEPEKPAIQAHPERKSLLKKILNRLKFF